MSRDWRYIAYVAGAVALFLLVKLLSPKQYNWSITLVHDDKNPYGIYALHKLIPTQFQNVSVRNSYQTLYELKDSLKNNESIIIFASNFMCAREDTEALLDHVSKGATAFISAHYFLGHFSDTLNISASDYFFSQANLNTSAINGSDTSYLNFANHKLDSTALYQFKRDNTHNYFDTFDTTRTTVIANNDYHKPVTIKMSWGKGNLILNSTPLAFTNIYLMSGKHHEFAEKTFSYLPTKNIEWTEYYQVGRREARTPLRFILTSEPLRWAYYIIIVSILFFMLFEAKRKQRVIPVIKPLANTTLEFVSTIGNLYYQKADHKDIAEKKIQFLFEQIRTKYWLNTNKIDDVFLTTLASKSGKSLEEVMILFKTIKSISTASAINPGQLMDLNQKIEKFNL